MIVIYGSVEAISSSGEINGSTWQECIEECWQTWNCTVRNCNGIPNCQPMGSVRYDSGLSVYCSKLVSQTVSTECTFYYINQAKSVILATSGTSKVALKTPIPSQCPSKSENPPLFGNSSSEVIVTDGTDFYRTEIRSNGTQKLTLSYSFYKCLKDIPSNYTSLAGKIPKRYVYMLSSPFLQGNTFFIKGKIASCGCSFSISFYCSLNKTYPIYIKILNNYGSEKIHQVQVSTWTASNYTNIVDYSNPYNNNDEFEIRVNISSTQAFIFLNDTKISYPLDQNVPVTSTDQFIINDTNQSYENVDVEYLGWTGECSFEAM